MRETVGGFVDKEHRARELKAVLEAKKVAETEQAKIARMKDKANPLMQQVIKRIEITRPKANISANTPSPDTDSLKDQPNPPRRTDRLSQYSKNERKLISKIFSIIFASTDTENAENIVSKIEEGLQ